MLKYIHIPISEQPMFKAYKYRRDIGWRAICVSFGKTMQKVIDALAVKF